MSISHGAPSAKKMDSPAETSSISGETFSMTDSPAAESPPPESHPPPSLRSQRNDNEEQETRLCAAKALHQNSVLTMHVIASGEV